MHRLSTEQAAYWAGVIDGEGCISIYGYLDRSRGGCTARVHIANTKREWLEQLQAEVGAGKLSAPRANGPRERAKLLSSLWFNRPEILALLPQIRPFLRMKHQQADLVLRYFAVTDSLARLNFKRATPPHAALLAERNEILTAIRALNQRGMGVPRSQQPTVAFRKCGLASCGLRHFCKGYCRKHYKRYVESGGPVWLERSCPRCGKPFVARTKARRFCSKACNHAAWMAAHRESQVTARREARRRARKVSP